MTDWYRDSLYLLHLHHPFSPSDDPPSLTGFDRDQAARLLSRVRPDAVSCLAKGQAGYVPYPTRFGNALPGYYEGAYPDLLRAYREITEELGIRYLIGYTSLVDRDAGRMRPDWLRVDSRGQPYPNRALCPNAGYVDDTLLPQLTEILDLYAPDGIWLDAENWTVSPCWCTACETEFQMLHERSAPVDRHDSLWSDWLAFHRESFQRYLVKVGRFLHDRREELVFASSAAFCTHQPERIVTGPDRLTWDLSGAYSLAQAGMEARFLDGRGLPFDLQTPVRCSPRPGRSGRLPALPAYRKSDDHLAQEGAVILAQGGRWSLWVQPHPDDSLPESDLETAARAAGFARERQPWRGGESRAGAAILHSAATHQRVGNGLYDPGPSLDRIRGAHQLLRELHWPHDIVEESTLPGRLDRYQLLLLPDQAVLSPDLEAPLLEWIHAGGCLVASGRVGPRILEDIPTFALEEALGIRWTGGRQEGGYLLHRGLPLPLPGTLYHAGLYGAEFVSPILTGGQENLMRELGYPAVTRNAYGSGQAWYLAADLFSAYHRCPYPGLRELLGDLLERAVPEPFLLTTAPPTLEVAPRRRGEELLVHLVHHDPGKSLAQNSAFIERVPVSPGFTLSLRLGAPPSAVRLQPGDREPEWSFSGEVLTVQVPGVRIHEILVVV